VLLGGIEACDPYFRDLRSVGVDKRCLYRKFCPSPEKYMFFGVQDKNRFTASEVQMADLISKLLSSFGSMVRFENIPRCADRTVDVIAIHIA